MREKSISSRNADVMPQEHSEGSTFFGQAGKLLSLTMIPALQNCLDPKDFIPHTQFESGKSTERSEKPHCEKETISEDLIAVP